MTATWPAKTNYATGDVLTAANMNSIGEELNDLYSRAPGDITGVTAGTGLTGGGTTGDVTLAFDVANYGGGQYAAGKNKILNGDFGIWQRGTSFSNPADSTYTADRFMVNHNGTGATRTISQQAFTYGTAPVSGYEGTYFYRYAVTAAGTGNTYQFINQRMEDVRTFAGQTITVSFWAKADSSKSITVDLEQYFGSGGSSSVYSTQVSNTVTTSWARYTATITLASISGKTIGSGSFLNLRILSPSNSTITLDLWGIQVEAGSTATPFQTATGTKQGELAACQRYYVRYSADATYSNFATGGAQGTVVARGFFALPVEMRSAPTTIESSNLAFVDILDNIFAMSSVIIVSASENKKSPMISGTVSGATAGRPGRICANNSTSAYVAFSAEL